MFRKAVRWVYDVLPGDPEAVRVSEAEGAQPTPEAQK
jgi:hypothetical protein